MLESLRSEDSSAGYRDEEINRLQLQVMPFCLAVDAGGVEIMEQNQCQKYYGCQTDFDFSLLQKTGLPVAVCRLFLFSSILELTYLLTSFLDLLPGERTEAGRGELHETGGGLQQDAGGTCSFCREGSFCPDRIYRQRERVERISEVSSTSQERAAGQCSGAGEKIGVQLRGDK